MTANISSALNTRAELFHANQKTESRLFLESPSLSKLPLFFPLFLSRSLAEWGKPC